MGLKAMSSVKTAVILAGGMGTRIAEETSVRPKPLIEIGGLPILWHIMKIFHTHGIKDFVVCLGYKGYLIKEYFSNYFLHQSDVTFNFADNSIVYQKKRAEDWTITLVDTGPETMTGGRIKRVKPHLNNEPFLLTYGDGVSNVNIRESVEFHKAHGKLCTVTSVQPSGRFGALNLGGNDEVLSFAEKPRGDGAWINGGFFVCEPGVLDYIQGGDPTIWEREPMEHIARDGQMQAYKHEGFWKPMDTLRDKLELENAWASNQAPWKLW